MGVKSYYSTFIPGLLEPVSEVLRSALPDVRITLPLDGLIGYDSNAKPEAIRKLAFATNTFYIIKRFAGEGAVSLESMATKIIKERALNFAGPVAFKPGQTFRIVTAVANQLVPLENSIMQMLEHRISERTPLRSNRSKPDWEIWLSQRSEGYGFLALRITYHKSYDKILQPGELRPELAYILCSLSNPRPDELFLDPFAGSGAIAIQRAKHFSTGLVIASDNDEQKVKALKQRVADLGLRKRIVVRADDALHLTRYQDGSIHKIVTDPPWGHFAAMETPIEEFYVSILSEFGRLLRDGGLAVILTGETAAMESAIKRSPGMNPLKKFNILVSGKKASVHVLRQASGMPSF
jgi:tRNA (guanine6-N2)-methyltransferase